MIGQNCILLLSTPSEMTSEPSVAYYDADLLLPIGTRQFYNHPVYHRIR